jgi:hypothetical protein
LSGFYHKGCSLFARQLTTLSRAQRILQTFQETGWKILLHPPYSRNLAPIDFHLFGPLKEFLEGKHFKSDDEVKNFYKNPYFYKLKFVQFFKVTIALNDS